MPKTTKPCTCGDLSHGIIIRLDESRHCTSCGKDWSFPNTQSSELQKGVMSQIADSEIINPINPYVFKIQQPNTQSSKLKWKRYFICKGTRTGESNCGKVFFNDDDNVCIHCGSKNTRRVHITHKKLMPF